MSDEQQKALDESIALAQQLEDEEMKNEQQSPANQGESISAYVNQQIATQLIDMGFPKAVAEKSLFFTQGAGTIEKALEWIDEHSADPDFNEELKIVG